MPETTLPAADLEYLVVVYDYGALSPLRLAPIAAGNGCRIAYVLGSDHAREMKPILEMTGTVVEASGASVASGAFGASVASGASGAAWEDERELVARLRALRPAGILTFSEYQHARTARLADALGLPYHAAADMAAITRKDAQRGRLAERGIDHVRFAVVSEPAEIRQAIREVGLPLVAKPVVGCASRNTVLVEDEARGVAAVTALLQREQAAGGPEAGSILLEEYLPGNGAQSPWSDCLGVDCLAAGAEVTPVFVVSKFALAFPFRESGGYGPCCALSDGELAAIKDLACRAVRAVGIQTGFADVEVKLTPAGPRIIEVNGRLGGWVDDLAVRSGGASPGELAVKAALGRPIEAQAPPERPRIAYYYLLHPPSTASTVTAVHDLSALRGLDCVDVVKVLARPGDTVDWSMGTASAICAVSGITDTLAQLADTIGAIERGNWFSYR
jgi:predicted ATP-grasp superfamily ATP-dependent carboligase